MPAFRNIRRSRRISRQPPRDPNNDEFDVYDLNLMYPDAAPASPSSTTTPDAPLPPADDSPEPEIYPDLPRFSTSQCTTVTGQRSSHSRKKKPGHVPRPPNAFILFRSDLWNEEKIKPAVEKDHRQISRIAGDLWNALTEEERKPYQDRAEEAKRAHEERYPQYKFSPVSRRNKPAKRKSKSDHSEKVRRCEQVARLMRRGFEGDDLERELEKCAARKDEPASDASEYVEGPRRKKARKSSAKKASTPSLPERRSTQPKSDVAPDHEAIVNIRVKEFNDVCAGDVPIKQEYVSVKQESAVAESTLLNTTTDDDMDGFVPTSNIPEFYLGSPAYASKVEFTNPFASAFTPSLSSIDTPPSSHDSLSPASGPDSLSDDFLGSSGEELQVRLSSPDAIFVDILDVRLDHTFSPYDDAKPPFTSLFDPGAYYAGECLPELGHSSVFTDSDFFDWVKFDHCP